MKKQQRAIYAAALATATMGIISVPVLATDNLWIGGTAGSPTDWNTASNWSQGRVPVKVDDNNFDDAIINVNTGFPVINADLSAVPRDVIVGGGAGTSGRVDQTAGTATTGSGNWLYVARDAGTGVYNLANTATTGGTLTGYGTGSGSIDVGGGPGHAGTGGRLYVGGTEFGAGGAVGTLNVNTTGTLTVRNDLAVGTDGGTGVMNVDAGTITTGGWNFIGKRVNADGGNGTLNMSGGTLTNTGRTYVGQTTTTGKLVLSGGTYNNTSTGDPFIIGEGAASNGTVTVNNAASTLSIGQELWIGQAAGGTGTMNVSAGTVTTGNWLAVGREGATGVLNVSGNGVVQKTGGGHVTIGTGSGGNGTVNVSGNGTFSSNTDVIVAENNAAAVALVNQTGGKVIVGGNLDVQRNGTGTYKLSGGTLSVDGRVPDPVNEAGQVLGIDGRDGTFTFTGGRITRSNAGVINYVGDLHVGNKAAGLKLDTDKTFAVTGLLDVASGVTFDVTGVALPASGAGAVHLGSDGSILGSFDPSTTTLAGLVNTPNATFISEAAGEGGLFNAGTDKVFWVQENGGSVDLKYSIAPVPEPTVIGVIGLSGLAFMGRRRRK